MSAQAAADPHDLVRIHLRRPAAGVRLWCRRRNAPCAGAGRVLRHARRHFLRHPPHARFLLLHSTTLPTLEARPAGETRPAGFERCGLGGAMRIANKLTTWEGEAGTLHRAIDRLILGKLGNRFLSSWSFDLTWEYLMEQPYGDVY